MRAELRLRVINGPTRPALRMTAMVGKQTRESDPQMVRPWLTPAVRPDGNCVRLTSRNGRQDVRLCESIDVKTDLDPGASSSLSFIGAW